MSLGVDFSSCWVAGKPCFATERGKGKSLAVTKHCLSIMPPLGYELKLGGNTILKHVYQFLCES